MFVEILRRIKEIKNLHDRRIYIVQSFFTPTSKRRFRGPSGPSCWEMIQHVIVIPFMNLSGKDKERGVIYERPFSDESGDAFVSQRLRIFIIYIFNFF